MTKRRCDTGGRLGAIVVGRRLPLPVARRPAGSAAASGAARRPLTDVVGEGSDPGAERRRHPVTGTSADPQQRGTLEKLARRGTASVVGAACSAVFGVLLVVIVTNGFSPTVAGTLFAATSAS